MYAFYELQSGTLRYSSNSEVPANVGQVCVVRQVDASAPISFSFPISPPMKQATSEE